MDAENILELIATLPQYETFSIARKMVKAGLTGVQELDADELREVIAACFEGVCEETGLMEKP